MRFAISKLVLIPVTLPGPPLPSVSVLYFVSITVLVVPSSLLSGTLLFICSNCFNRWGESCKKSTPWKVAQWITLGYVSTCDGIVNVVNYSLTGMLSMTSNICIPLAWPWFVATDCYPWNSCCLSVDRVVFVGPCTGTAIIAELPCYSWMYMVLSTYVLYSVRYVYISPFFWWDRKSANGKKNWPLVCLAREDTLKFSSRNKVRIIEQSKEKY